MFITSSLSFQCNTVNEQKCETKYDTVYEQQCETVYNTQYDTVYEEKCETKYVTEYDQKCETKYDTEYDTQVRIFWKNYRFPFRVIWQLKLVFQFLSNERSFPIYSNPIITDHWGQRRNIWTKWLSGREKSQGDLLLLFFGTGENEKNIFIRNWGGRRAIYRPRQIEMEEGTKRPA